MNNATKINSPAFLNGGGEMGKLTREKDWSKTSLGASISWPQSLRTTLSIILNSKFPMFLFWGEELICFYNDAYRPSLGKVGKHPSILGGKGEEVWVEIWHIIKPIIDTVLAGDEASLYEDQLVPIYRDGKIEDVYWTFSYSPVNDETGKPAGVFVACTETTEKIIILNKVKESEKRFHEMVAQAPVAICVMRGPDYIVEVANEKMLEIWGRTAEQMLNKPVFEAMPDTADQGLEELLNEVYKTGKPFIANELPVNIIRNGVPELVFLNFVYEPLYGYDKTISSIVAVATEVTEQINARNKIEQSEKILYNFFMHTPALMHILSGPEHVFGLANSEYQKFIGNRNPTGKKLLEAMPELAGQNFINILDNVYKTGQSFSGNEMPVFLTMENGRLEERYVNVNYIAIDNTQEQRDILAFAYDVTEHVGARKKIEESQEELKRFKHMADNATESFILMRADGTFAYLNNIALERWGYTREEVKHLRVPDVDSVYSDEVFSAAFTQAQRGPLPQFETLHKRKDGTIYPVEVNMNGLTFEGEPHLFAIARDISERKKLEKVIYESSEKIRNFILSAPVAMALYRGPQYIIEIVNKELLEIWNKPFEAVINKPVFEALPEVRGQGFEELLNKVYTTGEKFAAFGTPINLLKNGQSQTIYANLVYVAYRDANGKISGIIEVVSNVTEQVKAVTKVKLSEQRFSAAVEATEGTVWTNNAKGEMEGAQPGWTKLTGQTYEDYRGYGWASAVHSGDAQQTIDAWHKAVENKSIFSFQHRLRLKNGEWGHFSVRAVPLIAEEGVIQEWVGVHTNITAQVTALEKVKESEERFRSLVQTLPQLIWVTDAQGNTEFSSYRWKEYSGIEPGSEKDWMAILHPDDYEGINAAWGNSLVKGDIYKFDVRLKREDGEYRWHTVKRVPVMDKENNIVRWVGAFTEIQEQKIREEKKDEFISIASHEMKTPLTTAKAYLQMLELSIDEHNKDAKLYAKKASQSVNRLNELVGELLDVSKIRLGKLSYNIISFDFNDMINTTVENIQLTSPKHTIIKKGKVNSNVTGDKDRLEQVVINLLTNAIKYSPGADKVDISIEQENDKIKVSVKDLGIGIANESLYKIFDKYHRIEEHAVHYQGLGIGLFISYEIIQRHHGKLWAESEAGVGSTFYFTIPISNSHSSQ